MPSHRVADLGVPMQSAHLLCRCDAPRSATTLERNDRGPLSPAPELSKAPAPAANAELGREAVLHPVGHRAAREPSRGWARHPPDNALDAYPGHPVEDRPAARLDGRRCDLTRGRVARRGAASRPSTDGRRCQQPGESCGYHSLSHHYTLLVVRPGKAQERPWRGAPAKIVADYAEVSVLGAAAPHRVRPTGQITDGVYDKLVVEGKRSQTMALARAIRETRARVDSGRRRARGQRRRIASATVETRPAEAARGARPE